jgi:hypothetical protein
MDEIQINILSIDSSIMQYSGKIVNTVDYALANGIPDRDGMYF